jgi:hypothetical protein
MIASAPAVFLTSSDLVNQNGVIVSFMGIFHGVIDSYSLSRPVDADAWRDTLPVGTTLHARIVFVDHGLKSVRLSIRPHVLEMRVPSNLPERGTRTLMSFWFCGGDALLC